MDLSRDGNLIEAGVWFLLASVLLARAWRSETGVRRVLLVLVIALAVFGGSDLVESRTGAWWKPWWLFLWKAACVVTLFLGFRRYYALTREQARAKGTGVTSTLRKA